MEKTTEALPRKFRYEQLILDDIDSDATPEEIMAAYSEAYPALIGANVEGPELSQDSDALVYTFVTKVGTKGGERGTGPDFVFMEGIARIILEEDDEDPELTPSEALEVI
ncbi:MAG: PRTRC system protein C [Thermodesulfovibrionales bacterium]